MKPAEKDSDFNLPAAVPRYVSTPEPGGRPVTPEGKLP